MTNEVVLKVDNLGKTFKIYPSAWGRIKEWLTLGRRSYHKDFEALKDVSFEVRRGGFLGIIGPNGAGKSTLLKIITGVLEPTAGAYQASGKVLSLLELSGGMDNDLSGRENIIRSAQLLGFPDSYFEERMEQIAEFAELGDFFDQPLSVYSSGMRIRLAFSMFAFLECDVLILDEVLAVGDIFFRQKCYARLEELIKQNTAIVFVTHSTGSVSRYCDDVIVLNKGEVYFHGVADRAVQKYFQIKEDSGIRLSVRDTYMEEDYLSGSDARNLTVHSIIDWPSDEVFINSPLPKTHSHKNAVLTHLAVCDEQGQPRRVFKQGEKVCFYFAFQARETMGAPVSGLNFMTVQNLLIHSKNSLQHNATVPLKIQPGGRIRFKQVVKLDVAPGQYIFNLSLSTLHPEDYTQLDTFSQEEFREKLVPVIRVKPAGVIEVLPQNGNRARGIHGGLCNLAGEMNFQFLNKDQGNSSNVSETKNVAL